MHDAVIGLGSNLGSRRALLEAAVELLGATAGLAVVARSRLYATPAMTLPSSPAQPDFLNAALRVRWVGSAHGLLDVLLHVETQLGRVRGERWAARTLDLDLLWWSGGPVRSKRLTVPHPGLWQRAFALAPALDVAPEVEGASALDGIGGSPQVVEWSDEAGHADRPPDWGALRFQDKLDAVAGAATLCVLDAPPTPGGLHVLAWDPTPRDGDLTYALTSLRRAVGWGFVTQRAVVLDATRPRWRGRLIGCYEGPAGVELPSVPRLRLSPDRARGQVGLSLFA